MIGHGRWLAPVVCAAIFLGCGGGVVGPSSMPAGTSPASMATQPSLSASTPRASSHSPTPTSQAAPSSTVGSSPVTGWRQVDATSAPGPREDHTWTVDRDGKVAYLFGGRGDAGPLSDLWAFDLAQSTWSQVNIAVDLPAPAARFGHTSTWVPGVGLVVWSGQGASGFFDDIWAYAPEANAWERLPDSGDVPPARYGSCASLGPDGQLWVSHGFTDTGRFRDTRSYEFASGTWTDQTPAGNTPIERCLHDCFWSPSGQLVLYGGQTNSAAALGDIWGFDPGAAAWTEGPASDAAPRQLYSLAVVPGGGRRVRRRLR